MKVRELLEILKSGVPVVRIIDSKRPATRTDNSGVLFCDYLAELSMNESRLTKYFDYTVTRFHINNEISHKQYKELGLLPPFRPDLTAEYSLSDVQIKVYYDIYIDTAGKEE